MPTYNSANDTYKLTSGREIPTNYGIIGIDPLGVAYEGFDGRVCDTNFSQDERRELGIYMISLWAGWIGQGDH